MEKTYTSVRGTQDLSPPETHLFNLLASKARRVFRLYGYEEVLLPLLEEEAIFVRAVGETTDIVEKQMLRVVRNLENAKEDIVLRPEGTAQVARYFIENSLYKKGDFYKFCYFGPMFRGERPQRGRLRQFHHLGAEAIGSFNVFLDAEIMELALKILDVLGIKEKKLELNFLGCSKDKERFKEFLKEELCGFRERFCKDCQRRLEKNPLRVFDCKEEICRDITQRISSLEKRSYLCSDCRDYFKELRKILDELKIMAEVNFRLVRGLDYYTHTVFEITSSRLGAQNALGAGGRYNHLIKDLGGPQTPAVGFALGLERIMLALEEKVVPEPLGVFVAVVGSSFYKEGIKILETLRRNQFSSDIDYCVKSLKGQLRYAEKKGFRFVVILGEEEFKQGVLVLRDMQGSFQERIKKDQLIDILSLRLARDAK